jgi:hypothetical protein
MESRSLVDGNVVFSANFLDRGGENLVEVKVRSVPALSLPTRRLALWAEGAGRGFWRPWNDGIRFRSVRGTSVFSKRNASSGTWPGRARFITFLFEGGLSCTEDWSF